MIWQIIISCIGSSGLFAFLTFLIQRKDNKDGKLAQISNKLDRLERDNCRTQLLLLMSDYPSNVQEIMKVAQVYFQDLHGDWYVTTLFKQFLTQKHIGKPEWFDVNK